MPAHDTNAGSSRTSMTGAGLYMLTGPIVWAIHLTIIYGAHTLLCSRGVGMEVMLGTTLPVLVIAAVTVVALIALFIAMLAPSIARRRAEASSQVDPAQAFQDSIMRWLALLSFFGVAWAGATALIVAPCLAMR